MPVPATRTPLATMATGIVASASAARTQPLRVHEVAVDDAEREQRDQRPDAAAGLGHFELRVRQRDDVALAQHRARRPAAATTRRTATPATAAGNAIWLKMIAGIGIISSRNRSGNARTRRWSQPRTNRTVPPTTPMIEMRVRNSSAPRRPATSMRQAAEHDDQAEHSSACGLGRQPACRAAPRRSRARWARSGSRASSCRRSPSRERASRARRDRAPRTWRRADRRRRGRAHAGSSESAKPGGSPRGRAPRGRICRGSIKYERLREGLSTLCETPVCRP